jgi:hypothetical protein
MLINFRVLYRQAIFCLTEQLLAPQGWFCSVNLEIKPHICSLLPLLNEHSKALHISITNTSQTALCSNSPQYIQLYLRIPLEGKVARM